MLVPVLGLHDPQFYSPGSRPGRDSTTALTHLPTGAGRTRLASNLVAELKAPRRFLSFFFLLSFPALLGGYTILFATSRIKASPLLSSQHQRRLGNGTLVMGINIASNTTMFPPAVHPFNQGNWRLRTTSTMP